MLDLFLYNWQVRDDWFNWCKSISPEELKAERVGGMGSILKNLIHVIDCELLWLNYMLEKPNHYPEKDSITSLDDAIRFSDFTKKVTEDFISHLPNDFDGKLIHIKNNRGKVHTFSCGKILRHIITHEIHHIGQLSIWSREMDMKPVLSDLIIRNYT
ncbi:DinB family protein [Bacillus sp. ISL-35]|uniref:DinB family protein n=1 Tax=Bacillus sp. ISL-35 TaxID=2819122 RepID=UPI001BE730A4|nr:DinB family protein [Bacillus sp. ISL-35]MBT2681756.1 DinB family protein [Bacillus sp. ISL-35]MBT2706053.1 DinB family protein [Chryseobacterium sp. ISL-80]